MRISMKLLLAALALTIAAPVAALAETPHHKVAVSHHHHRVVHHKRVVHHNHKPAESNLRHS
jgi:hypothetical protein